MQEEGEIMTRIMESINSINIPTNVQKEIGLNKNWKKDISPQKVENIFNSALRFKEALRELSKN